MNKQAIGVFDSGVGGLTVAAAICELLPQEDIIYLGDTARLPYGTKSAQTVMRYAVNAARFLLERDVKMLVVACNTASSVALPDLQMLTDIPVLGVIEPGAQAAVQASENKRIGVIGTYGTIKSGAYQRAINNRCEQAKIFVQATPLFVSIAEEGFENHPATQLIAQTYLENLRAKEIDTLVLGCTHYPILRNVIHEVAPEIPSLVDSAHTTANEVSRILEKQAQLAATTSKGSREFFATDSGERFVDSARRFFGAGFTDLQLVDIIAGT